MLIKGKKFNYCQSFDLVMSCVGGIITILLYMRYISNKVMLQAKLCMFPNGMMIPKGNDTGKESHENFDPCF